MSTGIEQMAYELAGRISEEMTEYHTYDPQSVVADELLNLIRAVVRDEITKATGGQASGQCPYCNAEGWTNNTTCESCGVRSEL